MASPCAWSAMLWAAEASWAALMAWALATAFCCSAMVFAAWPDRTTREEAESLDTYGEPSWMASFAGAAACAAAFPASTAACAATYADPAAFAAAAVALTIS
ncbi:hypothetical protein [Streptomyces pratensis]|uniref:hypothetical protein n=1 Tax=Streptomyces pratensis TaxID=1169025 RepID=UPI00301B4597